eukprot:CAMPEP_0116068328 /NCGR_PEP_ID=MMETSP0322-20121206/11589_1 /TAXON_ID=163516 /ORGANISM="Leptocylindrus danicus var. apora, Strain B651" /LENGTH=646 /DNA_ID=CAMNT_0003555405 /DNA_START=58 /DNA_END=1995 /DNA_ORIENTATION=+
MSGARKLQTEIDRVMKKVDEGVILFDDIWEKVYAAEQQNQKEKHEMDLKKEIKKLQRLRDQIKSWIGSSDVKDKDPLIDARKLIETKMEQFKICEKETKTKTYSKEGLMRQEKLDPREEEKQKTISWIQEIIDQMQNLVDECDLEIERLSSGKGKKTNRHKIEDQTHTMDNHKFHITKLEGIMRLVNNDRLEAENVNELKEDLEYYLEAHDDDDYMMGYDEEMFYEILGLEDMDVVTVDRVTSIESGNRKKSKDDDSSAHSGSEKGSKSSKEGKKKKSSSSSSMIPLTIGRATVRSASSSSKSGKDDHEKDSKSIASNNSNTSTPTKTSIGIPTPTSSHKTAAAPGTSMASILKRESELQQEKERQAKAAQAAALQQQQQQQQQLLREQQAREQQARAQQQEQIRQQQAHQQRQDALRQQQEALKRQQQQLQDQQMRQAKENANKQQLQLQQQRQNGTTGTLESLLTSGLGSLSLGASELSGNNMNVPSPIHSVTAVSQPLQQSRSSYDTSSYLGLLNDSFLHCPSTADSERQRSYVPNNPYPVPTSFPTVPQDVFENPAVFEKMGTDCLFFIFYYSQGTYQQYLAARQLKKQNWRYHKKYMTWFQRHEEPKITTDEFEQGTYVYFDYETGWCKRLKSDFKFEYSF